MKYVRSYYIKLAYSGTVGQNIACYKRTSAEDKYDFVEIDIGVILKNIHPNSLEALKIIN